MSGEGWIFGFKLKNKKKWGFSLIKNSPFLEIIPFHERTDEH